MIRFLCILFLSLSTLDAACDACKGACGIQSSKLEEWLKQPVDSGVVEITMGEGGALSWKSKAILTFGTTNCDTLEDEYVELLVSHGMDEDYHFLSNYFPYPITVDGRLYKSSEHYYQAIKFPLDSKIYREVVEAATPALAKKIAAKYAKDANLGDDQEMSRRMKKALWAKFYSPCNLNNSLGIKLLATGDALIIEGNLRMNRNGKNVSDSRWGAEFDFSKMPQKVSLEGKNLLGKLLMELRSQLQDQAIHAK